MEIINQYKLYEDERKRLTTEEIIAEMRRNIGLDMIEAAVEADTRAILVNSPNNPTGAVYDASRMEALADLCRRVVHLGQVAQQPLLLLADRSRLERR